MCIYPAHTPAESFYMRIYTQQHSTTHCNTLTNTLQQPLGAFCRHFYHRCRCRDLWWDRDSVCRWRYFYLRSAAHCSTLQHTATQVLPLPLFWRSVMRPWPSLPLEGISIYALQHTAAHCSTTSTTVAVLEIYNETVTKFAVAGYIYV